MGSKPFCHNNPASLKCIVLTEVLTHRSGVVILHLLLCKAYTYAYRHRHTYNNFTIFFYSERLQFSFFSSFWNEAQLKTLKRDMDGKKSISNFALHLFQFVFVRIAKLKLNRVSSGDLITVLFFSFCTDMASWMYTNIDCTTARKMSR